MTECDNCGQPLDGTRSRWLCPRCGCKLNCCEGAPLPERKEETGRCAPDPMDQGSPSLREQA